MQKSLFAIFAMALLTLTSCQSNEEFAGEVRSTINLSSTENSVWHNTGTRATSNTKDFYYILDASSICQMVSRLEYGASNSYDKLFALGNYNVFCITNADPSGLPYSASLIGSDLSSATFELNTLTDVCLGQQTLEIVASKSNYDVNVPVNHTLAKLALSIAKIPADIETVTLTLGNVSKTFTLDGTFADDGTTLDLNLQKATTANADGTYDWKLPETLIYPCQSDAATTVITIVATDTSGMTSTYNTSASTVCSSGTRTSLTSTWRTIVDHLSYSSTENPWTEDIQQGTFDM